jgi:hypothetical protein
MVANGTKCVKLYLPGNKCYMQLQSPNSTLRDTIFNFHLYNVLFYCHLNFHANLLKPWRVPLKIFDARQNAHMLL